MMDPNDPVAVARNAGLPENLAAYMPRYVHIESGGNPNARTGSYSGLLQMGPDEIRRYGGSGLAQGAKMYADRANWFQGQYGRPPSPTELYLINQQGEGGVAKHMANPGAPAWQNMASTAEGQQKGEAWAKRAIWGNVPDDIKKQFPGGVDSLTSQQFMDIWKNKVEHTPIPPRPPADIPLTDAQWRQKTGAPPPPSTGDVAAASATGSATPASAAAGPQASLPMRPPGAPRATITNPAGLSPIGNAQTWDQVRTGGGGPSTAAPAARAAAPGLGSLGSQIASALSPRGGAAAPQSGYVDPTTGHGIVNPSGSGEQAMGITRDIGPMAASRVTPPAARPAPAPQRGVAAPTQSSGATTAPPPAAPVPPPRPDFNNARPIPFAGSVDPVTGAARPGQGAPDLSGPTPPAPPEAGALAGPPPPPPQSSAGPAAAAPMTIGGVQLFPPQPSLPTNPPPTVANGLPWPQTVAPPVIPPPQPNQVLGLSPFATGPQPQQQAQTLPLAPFQPDWSNFNIPFTFDANG